MLDYKNRKSILTVSGKKIETAWHGSEPDEAPTLVFLHEGLGCVSMWRDFPSRVDLNFLPLTSEPGILTKPSFHWPSILKSTSAFTIFLQDYNDRRLLWDSLRSSEVGF